MRASSDSIGAVVSPFMPDEEKLAAVRQALPATGAGIYLNTGWAGPIAAETAAAMAELAGWEVATGRAHAAFHDEELARMDEARGAIAAVIHAPLDAIALTHGTSDGINAALWSIDWQPGDNLVTTRAEFPGVAAAIGPSPAGGTSTSGGWTSTGTTSRPWLRSPPPSMLARGWWCSRT